MNKYTVPIGIAAVVIGAVGLGMILSGQEAPQGTILESRILEDEHRLGNPEAAVQLIEYGDLQCPACASVEPVIKQLMAEHGDWINFAYRHMPLRSIHPNAVPAAYAAEAAHKQGKFWEMKELLFSRQTEWAAMPDATPKFLEFAELLGLNQEQFIADMNSDEVKTKVSSDSLTAEQAGFNSTPTFVVNGERIITPSTYDQFVQLLRTKAEQPAESQPESGQE